MNTKALFAFGGGFAPKSIRKICTLHRYELEKLALSKLSRCFSPTQQTKENKKNAKLKVKAPLQRRLLSFITLTFLYTSNIFWRCACHRLQREIIIWKWHPGFGRPTFINEKPRYACAAIFNTQVHITPQTQPPPAMLCPCAAFCLQTELPWLALLMLIRSPVTLAFMVLLLLRTQVQNPNINRPQPFLFLDVISYV